MAASKASTSTVSSHADSILQRHFLEQEHETPRKLPNSQTHNTNQSRDFNTVQNANPNPTHKFQEEKKEEGPTWFSINYS